MTIKKNYQNGKLTFIGFDSLEEIFAYQNHPELLEEVPSNELKLTEKAREEILKNDDFKKFIEDHKE